MTPRYRTVTDTEIDKRGGTVLGGCRTKNSVLELLIKKLRDVDQEETAHRRSVRRNKELDVVRVVMERNGIVMEEGGKGKTYNR